MSDAAISVEKVSKSYGSINALKDVSFSVPRGSVCALLGPNGAGKTTLVEIIEGLRKPDAGGVVVEGLDPWRDARKLKNILGVQLQGAAMHDQLTVREALELFSSFYAKSASTSYLLDMFELAECKNTLFRHLSGGQKQRTSLALALVGSPSIIICDEPTVGLDPTIREELHHTLLRLKANGCTILLTTHYIEEAEKLADIVGFITQGTMVAFGRPAELIAAHARDKQVVVSFEHAVHVDALKHISDVDSLRVLNDKRFSFSTKNPAAVISSLAKEHAYPALAETSIVDPSLEDVYFSLNGGRT
ncbi:MAG TPA: ABC transporter ATP-binding protein [Candidatus Baltobacteraceae bacterium]|nr:ABC transporter ATP-binding protein [Candidatus Baltobacteraceae bacterium]